MGMFDYIKCDAPLPDGSVTPPDHFQTKDFDDPYMDLYEITASGRLVHHEYELEWIKDEAAPLGIWQKRHDRGLRDLNHHGMLNFYGGMPFREYNAKFTDGQLVEIFLQPQN